ncbi:HNH endonuclease signature motif containing protein [Phycicoccus sonneratiae]|uniref:HNH endonuclease n=1 Tax=Phycicoccus sonneratiae TaxID=2807628 RepID=A0ABS2CI62_9MICO|nr:HNH endonuclease signature motif containing protein [Phycicoccus sonneraticus]MBM6399560.1 HNH endonuclease [Phycicoccus sonneraticus]
MTTTDTVREAARAARALLSDALVGGSPTGSVDECAELLGELQALLDVAAAAQDEAIVALAAVECEWAEDGTVVQVRRARGHVALDAPAVVSGVLNVSAVHAERRVRDAVRRAADAPEGSLVCTGLGGLHGAMRAGRLDAYRAGVVAYELEEVPAEVAETVVSSLSDWFGREDGTHLRRRVRRLLASISPDLLRQRAVRAREASGLRRWVDEPGVDTWLGTFPSEEACRAWAAIDALAQQYVTDGVCERIDRARAKALTDLVTQQATIDLQVVLTTPADAPARPTGIASGAAGDLVPVGTARAGEPMLVQRDWLERAVAATTVTGRDRTGRPRLQPCDTATGAPLDPHGELSTSAYRPGARLVAFVRARDRHCRFPGCTVAARFCDLDHVRTWPLGPTAATNLACLCRRHHRLKQRPGWRAVLHPDASMTWTDPTGRTRTTHPPDQLHPITLTDTGTDPPPTPPGNPSLVLPDGPHSALEHHLEHRGPAEAARRVHITRPRVPMTCAPAPHDHAPRLPRRRDLTASPPF